MVNMFFVCFAFLPFSSFAKYQKKMIPMLLKRDVAKPGTSKEVIRTFNWLHQ